MALYLYGEDALTHTAVTSRLPELLHALEDATPASACVVFYRPSFGRRASGRSTKPSAFGEFDAIIGASERVYLVEAKWSRSSEAWAPTFQLRDEQLRRHRVLKWYLEAWRGAQWPDWAAFRSASVASFEATFPGLTIPQPNTGLALNLEFVIQKVAPLANDIVDVLLYSDIDGRPCPDGPGRQQFRFVSMAFSGADRSGFFSLDAGPVVVAAG